MQLSKAANYVSAVYRFASHRSCFTFRLDEVWEFHHLTPNKAIGDFHRMIDSLEDDMRNITDEVIVGRDLNTRAVKFGDIVVFPAVPERAYRRCQISPQKKRNQSIIS
ncbi:hypothetical protein J6590_003264 [Homalodisca vitripennis]|nr:hypothetical protein J6590_003264 [Homalodisca vitripennis]